MKIICLFSTVARSLANGPALDWLGVFVRLTAIKALPGVTWLQNLRELVQYAAYKMYFLNP